jgi:hypothetical protein
MVVKRTLDVVEVDVEDVAVVVLVLVVRVVVAHPLPSSKQHRFRFTSDQSSGPPTAQLKLNMVVVVWVLVEGHAMLALTVQHIFLSLSLNVAGSILQSSSGLSGCAVVCPQPRLWCLQQYSCLSGTHMICQSQKSIRQSHGSRSGGGGQATPSCRQHQSFFAVDHPASELATPAAQSYQLLFSLFVTKPPQAPLAEYSNVQHQVCCALFQSVGRP